MYLKIVLNSPSLYFMRKCRFYHLFLYKSFIKNLMQNFKNSNCYHKHLCVYFQKCQEKLKVISSLYILMKINFSDDDFEGNKSGLYFKCTVVARKIAKYMAKVLKIVLHIWGTNNVLHVFEYLFLVNAELAKYKKYQRFVQCNMLCQEELERMVIDEMFNMFKNCIVRLHFKQKKEFHRK